MVHFAVHLTVQCRTTVWELALTCHSLHGDRPVSIDLNSEPLLTFGQAAKLIPRRRHDRPAHPTTVWRWHKKGVKCQGRIIRLEALHTPSGLATTAQAIHRFLAELNNLPELAQPPETRTQLNEFVRDLDADGI